MNGIEVQPSLENRRLDLEQLRTLLQTESFGQGERLLYTPVVASTNTLAMKLACSGSQEGVVVLTDNQTAGKGRQGRRWVDMATCNAISSTILRPLFLPHQLVMMASLSVVEAIAETTGLTATIKWPNDVLIGEHKVSGILIETSTDQTGHLVAVIGIGINVNGSFQMPADVENRATEELRTEHMELEKLTNRAISLREACGDFVSREVLLAHLLRHMETYYVALQAEAHAGSARTVSPSRLIREQWRHRLSTLGRTIQVRQGDTILSGVAEDVNEHGELLLRCRSGERICITWGDVG